MFNGGDFIAVDLEELDHEDEDGAPPGYGMNNYQALGNQNSNDSEED